MPAAGRAAAASAAHPAPPRSPAEKLRAPALALAALLQPTFNTHDKHYPLRHHTTHLMEGGHTSSSRNLLPPSRAGDGRPRLPIARLTPVGSHRCKGAFAFHPIYSQRHPPVYAPGEPECAGSYLHDLHLLLLPTVPPQQSCQWADHECTHQHSSRGCSACTHHLHEPGAHSRGRTAGGAETGAHISKPRKGTCDAPRTLARLAWGACLRDLGAHGLHPVFCAIADR